MDGKAGLARRIIRHSPGAVGSVITAVTRGLNMGIAEGLQVESEQFAGLIAGHDRGEGLTAWIERPKVRTMRETLEHPLAAIRHCEKRSNQAIQT
jgi:enoyl-CoA hydratase/carnithine racemase